MNVYLILPVTLLVLEVGSTIPHQARRCVGDMQRARALLGSHLLDCIFEVIFFSH